MRRQGRLRVGILTTGDELVPPGTPLPPVIVALEALRTAGLNVVQHAGGAEGAGSMKSQFKKADGSGARFALVFGAEELAQGHVAVKSLRDGEGAQRTEPLNTVAAWAHSLQSAL